MSSSGDEPVREPGPDLDRFLVLVDSSLGMMSVVARTTVQSTRTARRISAPLLHGLERLPVDTSRSRVLTGTLQRRGNPVRENLATTGAWLIDLVVPFLLEQALRRVDLTDVVRRHLDLDRVVAEVDLDAVVDRVDVDAVATRLDVDAVLDRLDLTALAMRRLDLATLVSAVLAQIDLVAIAEQIIEAVDLPGIIRDSSGALTSDTVRGARMRSAAADQALGRVRDRLLPRRGGSQLPTVPTGMPVQPGSEMPKPLERP